MNAWRLTLYTIPGGTVPPRETDPPPPAGSFRLKAGHSGQCVEVNGHSTAAAAQLVQNTCSNSLSQYWLSVANADGFMLKNAKSNLCLGVNGGSLANGTNVIQWPCDRGANSTLYRSGNTVVFKHSRQCLSVYGALPAAGTGLVQSICTGGSHQAITGGGVAPLPPAAPPAGSFRLKVGHSGQCVEVNGQSTAAAAQLVQNTCSNSLSQYWLSVANADGFMLKNAKSNQCLAVSGGSQANGTNVIQWSCDRGANSTLYRSGDTVVFKHSRQCLSAYGALPTAGTGLIQSTCTGGSHQAITGGGVAPLPPAPDSEAVIEGVASTDDGTPVPNVQVELFAADVDGTRQELLESLQTEADGGYRFTTTENCHVVTFTAPDGMSFVDGATNADLDVCVDPGQTSDGHNVSLLFVVNTNNAPVLTNPDNQSGIVGDSINLTVTATDEDGDSLHYSATNLPDGLTIDSVSGKVSGSPSLAGVYSVTFSVSDNLGGTDSASIEWTINDTDTTPPVLSNIQVVVTDTTTTITWDTDELSNSTVNYGLVSNFNLTESVTTLVSSHTITLTGLTADTQYHFEVLSSDASGNSNVSTGLTFTTDANGDDSTDNIIKIDGDASDWSSVTSYQDTANENTSPVDFETIWQTADADKVYVAYRDRQAIDADKFWAWHVLIDSDYQTSTGFNYGVMGADYMLMGDQLYQYAGTGSDWQWTLIETVPSAVNGTFAEFSITRSVLGQSEKFRINFYGANTYAGGVTNDLFFVDTGSDNSASIIQVDGNADDWSSITSYQDTANENTSPVDFETVWYTADADKVYVAYQDRQAIDTDKFWAWQVLIDSDYQTNTGFNYGVMGADHMLLGDQLYQYAGTGDDWQWTLIETVPSAVNGAFAEFAINRSVLGQSEKFRINFYGANTYAGGVTNDLFFVDTASDNSASIIQVDGNADDWSSITSYQDTANENTSPVDFETVWHTADADKVYVAYQNRQAIDTDKFWAWQVLIDSDYQTNTGFNYGVMGADHMLLADQLYQYTGTGDDWQWTLIETIPSAVNGAFAEFAINRSLLGQSEKFRFNFYGANTYAEGVTDDLFFVDSENND